MTIFRLGVCLALASIPALAADSVFVPNAFVGNWATTVEAPDGGGNTVLSFSGIPAAQGRSQIDSLGDPTFSVVNCPPSNQKSEYYRADASQGETTFFGCTNGSTLVLRYIDLPGGDIGTIIINSTNIGPPAVFSGSGTSSFSGFLNLTATYLGGNVVATPLARVPSSYILIDSITPPGGTTFVGGTTQNFSLNVRYQLGVGTGTLTALLVNGANMTLKASTPVVVNSSSGELATTLVISQAFIPANPSLKVVVELRRDVGTIQATAEVKYSALEDFPVSVIPSILEFNRTAPAAAFVENLQLTATGGASVPFTVSLVNGSSWLSAPAQGDIANGVAILPVTFHPEGLAPGFYSDTVRIVTATRTINIPVALTIGTPLPTLSVEPDGIRYEPRQGQGFNATRRIYITASGGALPWTAAVTTGSNVVRLGSFSGVATPGTPSELLVNLQPGATNTPTGAAYAVVEISTPGQPPQYVTVVANILPAAAPVIPQLDTASVTFVARQNAPNPTAQGIAVQVSSQAPVPFAVSATGGAWLSVGSANPGTASTTTSGLAVVSVNTAGLVPGVYNGAVNASIGPNTRTARVVLIVQPPLAPMSAVRKADGCTPTRVVLTETRLPESYTVPAGWPQDLIAHLYDDCGNAISNGTVIASFNNGDAPLRLLNDGLSADYFATWQPQGALLSNTIIKFTATAAPLQSATLEIRGTVATNAFNPPSLLSTGVVHIYNPVIGGPVAPGNLVLIYGKNLAGVSEATPAPLPGNYKGTQILVEGRPSPFFYVDPEFVVAQLPTDLLPARSYPVVAQVNGAISVPINIAVVGTRPGVATLSDGRVIAQHGADYSLVTDASPAKPGESLLMYLTGLGATNPSVQAGAFTPLSPLSPAAMQPTVTVDGTPAQVQFAGLTPTAIGLFQINFVVPATARSGDLDLVITQNGTPANATKLIVRK